MDIRAAPHEGSIGDNIPLQGNIRLDALDDDLVERHPHARQG